MIVVDTLKVVSFSNDFFDVTWTVEDTNENILNFDFFVQRSESPEGPFDTLAGPLVDKFSFRDTQAPQYYRGRGFFYKIRIVERSTGTEGFSDTALPIAGIDQISAEIQRCEFLLHKEFTGRKVFIFPKRTFGQRCTACWDATKNRVTSSRCIECFDTGFTRGFFSPIQTFMQIDPSAGLATKAEDTGERGKEQHNIVSARMIIFPLTKSGDVVVEAENTRWRVVGTVKMQHIRHPVTQQATLLQIPEGIL